ncbi:vWA domain-containing protein [Streptococcus sp. SS-4456]|uniref:vWA domain-containing protein n=1 Tax=Streptococcus sp. SS-4456 TaxID=3072286 RepID=UPI002FCAD301
MKTIAKILTIFLVAINLVVGYLPVFANGSEVARGMEVIFVVDDSASMQDNDPNKLAGEAVRRFVDLLPAEGDKLGILTYSFNPIERQDLMTITGKDAKQKLKDFSIQKITQKGHNTDTAAGLAGAAQMLEANKDSQSKKAVVLITDGANDFRNTNRTEAESNAVLSEFMSKGYPVYTIGINPETDHFKNYLITIAQQSGAKSWFPKSADELNGIIKEVAAVLGNIDLANSSFVTVKPDQFTDIVQKVPKAVLEANIQIDHEEPISIEVVNTAGKTIDLSDEKQVLLYSEERYTNVKLLHPEEGDWTIRVKSKTKQIQVKVDWIFNHDAEVKLEVPEDIKVGKEAVASVKLGLKGVEFTPENYSGFSGELTITNVTKDKVETVPMSLETDQLTASFVLDEEADYILQASVKGVNFNKNSNSININLTSATPAKEEKATGLPLWLIIVLGLLGLSVLAVVLKLFSSANSGPKLNARLEIVLTDAGATVQDAYVSLPPKNKVALKDLLKQARMKSVLGGTESKIFLVASRNQARTIHVEVDRKVTDLEIIGNFNNTLKPGDEIGFSKNGSLTLTIRYPDY